MASLLVRRHLLNDAQIERLEEELKALLDDRERGAADGERVKSAKAAVQEAERELNALPTPWSTTDIRNSFAVPANLTNFFSNSNRIEGGGRG